MNAKVFALAAAAHRMGMMTGQARGPRSSPQLAAGAATDPHDVLAQLSAAPTRDLVATGTPIDALAADRIGRGAVVITLGEPECGKTALAVASAAHRLRAGDHVLVHVTDRDPLVTVGRLAQLLGCAPAELAGQWPQLRVRTGDLARSVDLLAAPAVLIVDSVQAAAQEVRARADAPPHERIELVLRELRRAALAGALAIATSERAPSGDARHSHAVGYAADVLVTCERDSAGRFSVECIKPFGRGLRWYTLAADGWPEDCTARPVKLDVSQFVAHRHTARRPGKRRADNPPAVTDAAMRAAIREFIQSSPGCKTRDVCEAVTGRDSRIVRALRELVGQGVVVRKEGGLRVVAE